MPSLESFDVRGRLLLVAAGGGGRSLGRRAGLVGFDTDGDLGLGGALLSIEVGRDFHGDGGRGLALGGVAVDAGGLGGSGILALGNAGGAVCVERLLGLSHGV